MVSTYNLHSDAQARATSVNLKGLGHILLDLAHGLEGPDGRALGPGAIVRHFYMYRWVECGVVECVV